jgi:hypothetical protein
MQSLNELTQLFDAQRKSSRLHHAWIIEGLSESESDAWLINAAGQLVNSKIDASHFHPNLFWLNSSDPHNVDAARLAINFLEKMSWDGGWKVCVILSADKLNAQAQNALLKIMEEPSERSIIFLTSERSHTLLPTLYSRGLHIVLSDNNSGDQLKLHKFIADWMHSVVVMLERQDFTPLFALQAYLAENEIDAETQSKWVMLALKQLIDADPHMSEDGKKLLSLMPGHDCLQRWTKAQTYLSQATEFKVDEKQFCIKLTAKILGEFL